MIGSITRLRLLYRFNGRAPVACALLFFVVWLLRGFGGSSVDRAGADARVAEIAGLIDAIPYRLGDWAGENVPMPAGALEILHSSAVLSRSYANIRTGQQAAISIVFCGDVRDMLGHHPPSCYPASGWRFGDVGQVAFPLVIRGSPIEANLFRFESVNAAGIARRISIVGFFALPGVGLTRDPEVVRERSARRAFSSCGAGQIQVLTDGWPEASSMRAVAEELLESLPNGTLDMLISLPADKPMVSVSGIERHMTPVSTGARVELAGPTAHADKDQRIPALWRGIYEARGQS